MKLSEELDYRIRYDVEHDLFHAQNVFNDEYIKPTFIEYVQKLEKENEALRQEWEIMKNTIADYDDFCDKYIKLEKENAELKDDNKVMADNYSKMEQKFYDNLTKAKEIIRMIIDSYNHKERFSFEKDLTKAKQFLQESE